MIDKAYIVANEQQEREVLEKLEQEAVTWWFSLKPASQFIPSKYSPFPYGLKILGSYVVFASLDRLEGYEIVFDGRKEEHMSDKYVVSQEFMKGLEDWKDEHENEIEISLTKLIDPHEVNYLATIVDDWWLDSTISNAESNNRLIAIIRWVNGEDVFEVEKQKKWIIRSKDIDEQFGYQYVTLNQVFSIPDMKTCFILYKATKFDTKEEAESWANAHQEVIEVDE